MAIIKNKTIERTVLVLAFFSLTACSSNQVVNPKPTAHAQRKIVLYDDSGNEVKTLKTEVPKVEKRESSNDDFITRCPQAQLPLYPDQGPYTTEALFVQIPSTIGRYLFGTVGYGIGLPLGLFGYPLDRAYNYCTAPTFNHDGGFAGAALIGLPFWVVKGVFWDFPGYLISGPS